jgi:4-hydroxy-tetrahydrodipicolinate synthase
MADNQAQISGVVPVIPTPFFKDQSIAMDAVASCVQFAAEIGVVAVCLPAYGSEFYKLSELERGQVVETAVGAAAGNVLVIAQSNHPAAIHASEIARANEARGADIISFALPRIFGLPEADLLEYSRTVCSAVNVPVLIQDFNPSGVTIGPDFCRRLADECPNFRYAKLEEPLMAPKLLSIREATDDRIGVLEGWGGLYVMELIPAGIAGMMPGLGVADFLQEVWRLATDGSTGEAVDLFEKVLPQIVFSLQSMELFLWMEKDLLVRRNVIPADAVHVRSATYTPDEYSWRHAQMLNERVAQLVAERRS